MDDTHTSISVKTWVKHTKILLRHTDRATLKNCLDDAADEIKHTHNENGDIIEEGITSVERGYGETVKKLNKELGNDETGNEE